MEARPLRILKHLTTNVSALRISLEVFVRRIYVSVFSFVEVFLR